MRKYLLAAILLTAMPVAAQRLAPNVKSYLSDASQRDSRTATADTLRAFIKISSDEALGQLEALGIRAKRQTSDILTAMLTADQLTALSTLKSVSYVQLAPQVRPLMDEARKASRANEAQSASNALGKAFLGSNVIVGIVDAGFEYAHADYLSPDGRFRLLRVWDQNSTSMFGTTPETYGYGKEFVTETEIRQARYDTSNSFHGGHVAGIAAGGDMSQPYYGVAPEADLVFVSYREDAADITDGVRYIADYAKSLGRPCVINVSLGSHLGPHDGTSLSDRVLDNIAGEGCIVVGACGNEGEVKLHARKVLTADDATMKTGIKFSSETSRRAQIDIWGTAGKHLRVRGVVFDARKGSIIASTDEIDTAEPPETAQRTNFHTQDCGVEGYISLSAEVNAENNRPNVLLTTICTNVSSNRMVGIVVTGDDGTEVNMWNASYGEFVGGKTGWTAGDTQYTVGEIGGTANDLIAVGCYQTKKTYTDVSGNTYPDASSVYPVENGGILPFSSQGPTLDGRMKPDVAAPGWIVVSAQSKYYSSFYASYAAASTTRDGETYYYDGNGGTSMAAPYVAGSVALWLEASPKLSPDDVRDIIRQTAYHDEQCTEAISNTWGYGKLDTYAGLAAAYKKETGIARVPGESLSSRATFDAASRSIRLTFRQEQSGVVATLYTASGMSVDRRTLQQAQPGTQITFDASHLAPGVYLLRVGGSNDEAQSFKIAVN